MTVASKDRRSQTAATTKIRDARPEDLFAIVEIHNTAIASRLATAHCETFTIADRRGWLAVHSPDAYPLLVREIEGEVAGWLSTQEFLPRCAYRGTAELSVYFSEKFRRRGIARGLLAEISARARPRSEFIRWYSFLPRTKPASRFSRCRV